MRLLVIVNVYRPDLGGGVLFADLCEGLAARGIDVEVRAAVPYYPEWRDKTGNNGLRILRETRDGVSLKRYGLYIPTNPGALWERLLYEASFFATLARDLPAPGQYDLVMAFCPLVGGVGFGALAARASGCPLWLNVQDLSAEAAAAAGIVKRRAVGDAIQRLQRYLFNRAEVWSTIAPGMLERLLPLAGAGQPVHLLPNWLHRTLDTAIRDSGGGPKRRGPAPSLLYSGNIGGKQGLLQFCQFLSRLPHPFSFRIQGDGTEAGALRSWLAEAGDHRFELVPLTDEAGLAKALRNADLFVVTEKAGAGGSFIPSKLLPAFGSGTAVLGVCDPGTPLGRELLEAAAGPCVSWSDLAQVEKLLADPTTLHGVLPEWESSSLARSQRYDREHLLDRYANLIRQAAGGSFHE